MTGLLGLLLLSALVLPLSVRRIEEKLEAFLLALGALAVTISGRWSGELVAETLREPVRIAAAVLIFGLAFRRLRPRLTALAAAAAGRLGPRPSLFLLVAGLSLASSAITAVIAALALSEVLAALRLPRAREAGVAVCGCFAIGLGAALTPLGEPLSTIAVARLAGPPHRAGFFFLTRLLGAWLVPAVALLAAAAAAQAAPPAPRAAAPMEPEAAGAAVFRAVKVYVFVCALVLLSAGLQPMTERLLAGAPPAALYWGNSVSALLDNATLAAAEVGPRMSRDELRRVLLGLLLAGGMLVPGNIPNIVCAARLGIRNREWARMGVPLGLALMGVGYALL